MKSPRYDRSLVFPGCVELAARRLGGRALAASDDFFAPKENLLKPGPGIFIADKFTKRGKWMDGWESRRKRTPGHDWCLIQLGIPGTLRGVDIDTNHFLGNHPPHASLDGCSRIGSPSVKSLLSDSTAWVHLVPKSRLRPGSRNIFPIRHPHAASHRWTHLRLNIYPDGGVARLRVYGRGLLDLGRVRNKTIDLAAITNGGCVVLCNDMFFGPKDNLIMPGRAVNMGDGWETRRKRGPGHDWVIVRLGAIGRLRKIEIDTNHFKGNFPDMASLEGCLSVCELLSPAQARRVRWTPILPKTKLKGHTRHFFTRELLCANPFSHIRLRIYPDGGISRLRALGVVETKPRG